MLAMATGQSLWKVPSNEKAIFCSVIRPFSGLNTALNYEKREGSSKVAPSQRRRDRIVLLSYRPGMEEPGPEKSFELSPAALAQRWKAGLLDMDHALDLKFEDDLITVRRK
jgi:hypothetical protein